MTFSDQSEKVTFSNDLTFRVHLKSKVKTWKSSENEDHFYHFVNEKKWTLKKWLCKSMCFTWIHFHKIFVFKIFSSKKKSFQKNWTEKKIIFKYWVEKKIIFLKFIWLKKFIWKNSFCKTFTLGKIDFLFWIQLSFLNSVATEM